MRVRQAVRGCVLEGDADAAARGVFDGLFGLGVEAVVLQVYSKLRRGGRKEMRWVYGSTCGPTGGRGAQSRAASRG